MKKTITIKARKEGEADVQKKDFAIDGRLTIQNLQGQVVFEQEFIHVRNNTNYKVNVVGIINDTYVMNLSATGVISL